MKHAYIKAVLELILGGADIDFVLKNLARVLKENGHTRIHAQILAGVEKEINKTANELTPTVIVSKMSDHKKMQASIIAELKRLHATEAQLQEHTVHVDDSIVGGFIASYNDKSIDRSCKHALVELYRSVITH